jgi:hypothetical protein
MTPFHAKWRSGTNRTRLPQAQIRTSQAAVNLSARWQQSNKTENKNEKRHTT